MNLAFEAVLLSLAISLDGFASSLAYGTNRIRIPLGSAAVISLIGSGFLAVSLLCGTAVHQFIPVVATRIVSFLILFCLGVFKLFDSYLTGLIRKNHGLNREIQFSVLNLSFILNIYANPLDADADKSKVLSKREAAPLAVALSIDSLAAGFGIGLSDVSFLLVIGAALLVGFLSILAGCFVGNRVVRNRELNLGWLSGAILILLSYLKL